MKFPMNVLLIEKKSMIDKAPIVVIIRLLQSWQGKTRTDNYGISENKKARSQFYKRDRAFKVFD